MKKIVMIVILFCSVFAGTLEEQLNNVQILIQENEQKIVAYTQELQKLYRLRDYYQGTADILTELIKAQKDSIK